MISRLATHICHVSRRFHLFPSTFVRSMASSASSSTSSPSKGQLQLTFIDLGFFSLSLISAHSQHHLPLIWKSPYERGKRKDKPAAKIHTVLLLHISSHFVRFLLSILALYTSIITLCEARQNFSFEITLFLHSSFLRMVITGGLRMALC